MRTSIAGRVFNPTIGSSRVENPTYIVCVLPRERRLPIDQSLRYLAEDHGTRAIGIILSGTASDGVLGLKAIKANDGNPREGTQE